MRDYMLDGKRSSVWHQRKEVDIKGVDEDLIGINDMCEGIHELIENMRTVGAQDITLGGFSMGGHLALHAAYRHKVRVNRCFALSSFLIEKSAVYREEVEDRG